MKERFVLRYLVCLVLLLVCLGLGVSADCSVVQFSSLGDPAVNVGVVVKNLTDNSTLAVGVTDVNGLFTYPSASCDNVSFLLTLTSSNYSAVLSNGSVTSIVPLGSNISARVQLKNTLGSYLEAQDCSVAAFDANTSALVYAYNTLCKQDETYIDSAGNWASVSGCRFTDSQGWYYFSGEVSENLGFVYNHDYNLVLTCNAKSVSLPFHTDLGRLPDTEMYGDFISREGGYILVLFVIGFIVLLALGFVLAVVAHRKGWISFN